MPKLPEIQTTLDALFGTVDGYALSRTDRTGDLQTQASLTYGEMLLPSVARILEAANPQPGETFYDLGSGTGKVLVMADQLYPFKAVRGIEFLPNLAAKSAEILDRYVNEFRPKLAGPRGSISSKQGDMLLEDLSDADIVFVHSTCMPEDLLTQLGTVVQVCKPTTRFLLISRGFFGLRSFNLIEQFEFPNAWGKVSTCYLYQLNAAAVAKRHELADA